MTKRVKAPPVPTAIMQTTTNLRTRESMMVGSHMEGGWYPPFPVGDQGTSFGPYQMHVGGALTASGLSPAQAENPTKATKAMLGAYKAAVNQITEQLWTSNPEKAAEEAAFLAEKPAVDYYSSQGASAVDSAWSDTQDVLHGRKSSGGMPIDATTTSSNLNSAGAGDLSIWQAILGGPAGIEQYAAQQAAKGALGAIGVGNQSSGGSFGGIWDFFANPTDALERLGLIVFGAIIVIVGLVVLASGTRAGKAVAAGATRGVSSQVSGLVSGSGKAREARQADQQRRLGIAEKANQLGERKLALKESREQRLTARANVQRPAQGRHAKTAGATP